MKFFCDQCEAQYFIADEKIGAKGVKIRCKRCENIIIIRPPEPEPSLDDLAADEETVHGEDQAAQALKQSHTAATAIVDSPYQDDPQAAGDDDEDDDDFGRDFADEASDDFASDDGFKEDFAASDPAVQAPLSALGDLDDDDDKSDDLGDLDDSLSGFAPEGLDDLDAGADLAPDDPLADLPGDEDFSQDPFEESADHDLHADALFSDQTQADFQSPGRLPEFSVTGDDEAQEHDADPGLDGFGDEETESADESNGAESDSAGLPDLSALGHDGERDLLENELSGAFDNVFGEDQGDDDPFAGAEGSEDPDQSRRETRFYNSGEMAKVEGEREIADQGSDLEDDFAALDQASGDSSMFDSLSQAAEPSEASAPSLPALSQDKLWYVAIDDEQVGPESEEELSQRWSKRQIDADSLVWQSGMADWMPMRDVPELKEMISQHSLAAGPPQTEIERPGGLAGFPPLSDPGSTPFESSDPFAAVEDGAGMGVGDGTGGGWRPHGMTEIYQAASLAESSAMQAAPPGATADIDDDEPIDWKPGAAAALASLVEDEISSAVESPMFSDDQISSADDADLIAPKLKAPADALISGPALGLPAGLATPIAGDPFSQQLDAATSDDLNLAQLAGQSSMVMQRPSFVSKPKRELPWPLILGAGGGGLALIGLFAVVIILLVRDPAPQVVVQPSPDNVAVGGQNPVLAAAGVNQVGVAAQAGAGTQGEPKAGRPAAADTPAQQSVKAKDPEPAQEVPKANAKPAPKGRTKSTRQARRDRKRGAQKAKQPDPKPQPKPQPKPEPRKTKRSGNCDPILYPDGNCPTGNAAMAPSSSQSKKKRLSKTDILRVAKRNLSGIKKCAAEQRKRNPRLATGTLKMSWYIRPDGRTKNVSVATAKYKGTYVGDCVTSAIKRWRFSRFDGDEMGPINFPFPLD